MSAGPAELVAVDTSVSVPLVVASHPDHVAVTQWGHDRTLVLCGHAAVETYSVLTRLPGDLLATPNDALLVMSRHFSDTLTLPDHVTRRIPETLADANIFGGAVYDGLVALAAAHHGVPLATRDARARRTYTTLGVTVELVPTS